MQGSATAKYAQAEDKNARQVMNLREKIVLVLILLAVYFAFRSDSSAVRNAPAQRFALQQRSQRIDSSLDRKSSSKYMPRNTEIAKLDSQFSEAPALWSSVKSAQCGVDWAPVVQQQLGMWLGGDGITHEMVRSHCVRRGFFFSYVRRELRMGKWKGDNMNGHRALCGAWFIQMAALRAEARGNPIPDFELHLQPGDSAYGTSKNQFQNPGPSFGNVKCGSATVSFPLTFHDSFGIFGTGDMSLKLYDKKYHEMLSWEEGLEWRNKNKRAFFAAPRGAGDRGMRSNIFKINSTYLEATRHSAKVRDFAKYQFSVYAYGHCGWSRRIHELAMMNSVVFMEDSPCREFFHGIYKPGVDHVPVANNFSDLQAKLEDMAANPEAAATMASKWYKLNKMAFSLPCVLDYVEEILRAYARLLTFEPEYHPNWLLYNLTMDRKAFVWNSKASQPDEGCSMYKPKRTTRFKAIKC